MTIAEQRDFYFHLIRERILAYHRILITEIVSIKKSKNYNNRYYIQTITSKNEKKTFVFEWED